MNLPTVRHIIGDGSIVTLNSEEATIELVVDGRIAKVQASPATAVMLLAVAQLTGFTDRREVVQ